KFSLSPNAPRKKPHRGHHRQSLRKETTRWHICNVKHSSYRPMLQTVAEKRVPVTLTGSTSIFPSLPNPLPAKLSASCAICPTGNTAVVSADAFTMVCELAVATLAWAATDAVTATVTFGTFFAAASAAGPAPKPAPRLEPPLPAPPQLCPLISCP